MKALLNLFKRDPTADLLKVESGFSVADRRALIADLAHADAVEAGLGQALARFVITGDRADALLRMKALLTGANPKGQQLRVAVGASRSGVDVGRLQKRREQRERILFGLEGLDADGLRRLGIVAAEAEPSVYGVGTDASPHWLRALFSLVRGYRRYGREATPQSFLTAENVRAMLASDDLPITPLIDIAFATGSTEWQLAMPDLKEVLAREASAACAAYRSLPADGRVAFLRYLADKGLVERVPAFFDLLFASTADKAKGVREAGMKALLRSKHDDLERRALTALKSEVVDDRLTGVGVLAGLGGARALSHLETHLEAESSKRVIQAIELVRPRLEVARDAATATQDDGPEGYTSVSGERIAPPERRLSPDSIPTDTAEVFRKLMVESAAASRQEYDDPRTVNSYTLQKRGAYAAPHDPRTIDKLIAVMKGEWRRDKKATFVWPGIEGHMGNHFPETQEAYRHGVAAFLTRQDVGLKSVTRLVFINAESPWTWEFPSVMIGEGTYGVARTALAQRISADADFRDVLDTLAELGFDLATGIPQVLSFLTHRAIGGSDDLNPTIWPWFAQHFPAIDGLVAEGKEKRHEIALAACAFFPKLPRRYFDVVLDAAVNGSRPTQKIARARLIEIGEMTPMIVPLLRDGAQTRRAGAARWLAQTRDKAAIPALREALDKERAPIPKAAILAALDACGDDISDQFEEHKLLDDARRELPKLKVDYSAFIAREALPRLRWKDGRVIDPDVVDYWFARAVKLKQLGGDPLMNVILDRLDRDDATAMGQMILSTFVGLDTRKPTSDEANAYADAHADARYTSLTRYRKDYTRELAFTELRNDKLAIYLGSALDYRGLLALARHAPPGEVVTITKRFLRDHGKRANQCRALLDMLAGNPTPQSLQLILAVAKRHKQPGARKYAGELADGIAKARGWSAAELGDNTVPTLDLDARGSIDLPIGDKTFRAKLAEDKDGALKLAIENLAGKVVAALPSPMDAKEAEQAGAAKKRVTAMKKELKETVDLQAKRLHEAMCVGRPWAAEDFTAVFFFHPIMARLVRRLVLIGHRADGVPSIGMRLLDDGTLTDVEDNAVALDSLAEISIAHRATLGDVAADAWRAHLADYDVTPLFNQLDRPLLVPPDAKAREVDDRRGFMLDTLTLRSAAAKHGYAVGSTGDGGGIDCYHKPFLELRLAAVIGFSGDFHGNTEKQAAALHALRFVRTKGGTPSSYDDGIPLTKVPPILLQEAWADYHAIAAAGTGFDPDWKKKGLW